MARFTDKVALVAGAGGGIGRATAQLLARDGAAVLCADVDGAAAEATAAAIAEAGGRAVAEGFDITDPAACRAVVELAVAHFGRLDVLVNAAGLGAFRATPDVTLDEWDRVLRVNLTGVFLLCQAALEPLLAARGAIVNLASVAGVRAVPYNAAYCASKAGVILLTKSLAVEFGKAGLRANCVCPAAVDTAFLTNFEFPADADMSLFARASAVIADRMAPAEVAEAVAYLASDAAAHVTGTALMMDGGATA